MMHGPTNINFRRILPDTSNTHSPLNIVDYPVTGSGTNKGRREKKMHLSTEESFET